MPKFKHKKTNVIVEAEVYREGLEDGFDDEGNPFVINTFMKLFSDDENHTKIKVTEKDIILLFCIGNRIYKSLYPKKLFLKNFEMAEGV